MHYISSRENRFYKHCQQVARAAGSRRHEQILLEGVHLCTAWLDQYGAPEAVLIDADKRQQADIAAVLARCPIDRQYQFSSRLFRSLSDVVSPPGLLFLVTRPSPSSPKQLTQSCLLLDQIQDPGNLGTILRTAAALEIRQIFLTPGTVSPWSPKVLRSAQGAHFVTDIIDQVALQDWVERLQIPLAVTVLGAQQSLYQTPLNGPIAWAFGNESQGIHPKWQAQATHKLYIPHAQQIESLNVAVAAAVCLFEHHRQGGLPLSQTAADSSPRQSLDNAADTSPTQSLDNAADSSPTPSLSSAARSSSTQSSDNTADSSSTQSLDNAAQSTRQQPKDLTGPQPSTGCAGSTKGVGGQ